MGRNFTVNKVKCNRCSRKWKSSKHDIPTIADNCLDMACDLRTSRYSKIMEILRGQISGSKPAKKEEQEIVEIDDAILIKVDERGRIKTLQP